MSTRWAIQEAAKNRTFDNAPLERIQPDEPPFSHPPIRPDGSFKNLPQKANSSQCVWIAPTASSVKSAGLPGVKARGHDLHVGDSTLAQMLPCANTRGKFPVKFDHPSAIENVCG